MCIVEKLEKIDEAVREAVQLARTTKKDFTNNCVVVEIEKMKDIRVLQTVAHDIRAKIVSRGYNFETNKFRFELS